MNYLGIDVSKDKLDVYVNGLNGQFENKQTGFKALFSWLKKKKIACSNLHACLESTGKYSFDIAEFLHDKGVMVSIVNPCLIKNFAASLGSRNKTDKTDAEVIARFCEVNKPSLWEPPSAELKELVDTMRTIDYLKKERQALSNRLEGKGSKASENAMRELIKQIDLQIKILEREASELVSKDDDLRGKRDLLITIPSIGEQSANIILAETRGRPEAFDSARTLVAYFGLCPSNKQSGRSLNWSSLSKKGSSYFRSKLYFPVLNAIKNNKLIKEFYERLLANKKSKMQAICACMSKLLRIAYGVLKSGQPFDSNYHNLSFSS